MAVIEIILKENLPGLGSEADIVKVRKGYARNFLIPKGKAYEVNPSNLKRLNLLKAKRAEREAKELNEAEEQARRINKTRLEFVLQTGETGKAFGSVTSKDIEDRLRAEHNINVDRHRIQLDRPIKDSGEHDIAIRLHAEIVATLKVDIRPQSPKPVEAPAEQAPATSEKKPRRRTRTTTT
jgi:large subunit ribosomal protein L9